MDKHHNPKLSVIVRWYNFNSRTRQHGEKVVTFVAELRKLSQRCAFGQSLDDMLRDHTICGFNDSRLQRRLLTEKDLTFKKALEMAQAWETAESNIKDLQKPQGPAVHAVWKEEQSPRSTCPPERSCGRCGGQHQAVECRFKGAKCLFYKKKGHLAKVCRSKPQGQRLQPLRRHAPPHKTHQVGDGHEYSGDRGIIPVCCHGGETTPW